MNFRQFTEEQELLVALEKRDAKAFLQLGKEYKDDLIIYAYGQLNDRELAVDTVEEFFSDLWAEGRFEGIEPPIYKFLVHRLKAICLQKNGR